MTGGQESTRTQLHVVQVLNAREIVISGGSEAGLSEDDVVRVLSGAVSVKDPLSGEDLGELVTTKAVLRIYQVAPRYALARTFRTRSVRVSGSNSAVANIFSPPKFETRTETLVRDSSLDVDGELAVQPGDLVEVWEGSVGDIPSVTTWA